MPLQTNHRLWVLGPDESEVRDVELALREAGEPFVYGLGGTERVTDGTRDQVEALSQDVRFEPAGVPIVLYLVRCRIPAESDAVRLSPPPLAVPVGDGPEDEAGFVLRAVADGTEPQTVTRMWMRGYDEVARREGRMDAAMIALWLAVYALAFAFAGAGVAGAAMLLAALELYLRLRRRGRTRAERERAGLGSIFQQHPWTSGFAAASAALGTGLVILLSVF